MRLEYDDVRGLFALMPTPAVKDADLRSDFTVDLEESGRAADALVRDGVDCIMLNGTFGEGSTLTDDEWRQFTRRVVEAVDGRIPVAAGPTRLGTQSTIERAKYAEKVGADALFLGRPMWCKMSQEAIVEFYRDVAEAVPNLGMILYENAPHFKGSIEPDTWRQLADIPQAVAAKYAGGDVDVPSALIKDLEGKLRIMPNHMKWSAEHQRHPDIALACWTQSAPCDPYPLTILRDALFAGDYERAEEINDLISYSHEVWWPDDFMHCFSRYNIPMEKIRINAAGYIDSGPARPPYHQCPDEYAAGAIESGERWAEIVNQLKSEPVEA